MGPVSWPVFHLTERSYHSKRATKCLLGGRIDPYWIEIHLFYIRPPLVLRRHLPKTPYLELSYEAPSGGCLAFQISDEISIHLDGDEFVRGEKLLWEFWSVDEKRVQ